MSRQARFLAIAPYQGLKTSLLEAAKNLPSVQLDVIVANLEDAEQILQPEILQKYDVLISRGGTAEFIRRMTHIPLVQISISILDMLRMIQTARQSGDTFAIVGFGDITRPAKIVAEILQYELSIVEIGSKQEAESVLKDLAAAGCKLIIGDVVTVHTARLMGLNALLVNSGLESISVALNDAFSIFNSLRALRHEACVYSSVLDACERAILYRDSDGLVVYQSPAFRALELSEEQIESICAAQDGEMLYEHQNHLYSIQIKTVKRGDANGQAVFVRRMPENRELSDLQIRPLRVVEKAYCLYDQATAKTIESIIEPGKSNRTFSILGDPGTERELLAKHLHCRLMENDAGESLFITVKMEMLNSEEWQAYAELLHGYAQKSTVTLYFHDIHMLGKAGANRLTAFLEQISQNHRCIQIFSSTKALDALAAGQDYPDNLFRMMNGPCCYIPALNQRSDSIPAICSMMIGKCNTKYGKQVVGLEPDALEFLMHYTWPLNEVQLKNVITHTVIGAEKAYISLKELLPILRQPESTERNDLLIDTSLTLEEMEQEIIEYVLKRSNMNQTVAAQSLGLSRSTLWRKQKPGNRRTDEKQRTEG